ncbi:helicase [Tanacetum coccineum]
MPAKRDTRKAIVDTSDTGRPEKNIPKPKAISQKGLKFPTITLVRRPTNVTDAMQSCGMRKEITKGRGLQIQHSYYAANKIRVYNGMFCFTSFGARIDHLINVGRGLYTFRINGQNCHRIRSLLPKDGTQPSEGVNGTIVGSLIKMFDQNSSIVKAFQMARYWCYSHTSVNVELRLLFERTNSRQYNAPTVAEVAALITNSVNVELRLLSERTNSRQYNAPTVAEVAALITNDFGDGAPTRDIVVNKKDSGPKRILELHPSYMALQYPLLFPYGEDMYHDKIIKEHGITLLRGGRLFQQYLVDAYTAIEEQILGWTRNNQDPLRVDLYHNVCDAITMGDTNATGLGKRIVLPHSFTGGPRYMMQNYQDAMALCRAYGNPDMFIIFTSNPKWPEINEMLAYVSGQRAHD